MLRCNEPGWIMLACPDGRRGVWMRVENDTIELCAGKEGDEDYLKLQLREPVTKKHIQTAQDILETLNFVRGIVISEKRRVRDRQPTVNLDSHKVAAEVISAPTTARCVVCGQENDALATPCKANA